MISGYATNLSAVGGSWTLKIPVVIGNSELVWHFLRRGDIAHHLTDCWDSLGPWIVDQDGDSLLHVSKRPC